MGVVKRSLILAGLFVFVILGFSFFLWPTDDSRIRKLFKEGAAAMESKDLEGVMTKFSYRYSDNYGMTYFSLKERLKRELVTLSDITVEYEVLKIKVSNSSAVAEMDVRVIATSGTETGYIIGDIREPLRLRFTLEKERMKWLLVKTEREPGAYDSSIVLPANQIPVPEVSELSGQEPVSKSKHSSSAPSRHSGLSGIFLYLGKDSRRASLAGMTAFGQKPILR